VNRYIGLDPRNSLALLLGALLVLGAVEAGAFGQGLQDWQDTYGGISASGDNAQCQLCHRDANGGSPWNGYGWDIREALADLACDGDNDGDVSNEEAFACVESLNSDLDTGFNSNLAEIQLSTQPGWAAAGWAAMTSRAATAAKLRVVFWSLNMGVPFSYWPASGRRRREVGERDGRTERSCRKTRKRTEDGRAHRQDHEARKDEQSEREQQPHRQSTRCSQGCGSLCGAAIVHE